MTSALSSLLVLVVHASQLFNALREGPDVEDCMIPSPIVALTTWGVGFENSN